MCEIIKEQYFPSYSMLKGETEIPAVENQVDEHSPSLNDLDGRWKQKDFLKLHMLCNLLKPIYLYAITVHLPGFLRCWLLVLFDALA